jgi:hypothetical protein
VNLGLAKDQRLSLNPQQISGSCGRLLCCLRYEHDFYVASRKRFPKEGRMVQTAAGAEKVVAVDIFRERVFLRGEDGSRIIPLVQLREDIEAAPRETDAARVDAPASEPAPAPEAPGTPDTTAPTDKPRRRRRRRGRRGRGGGLGGTPPSES